jgi:hypothetical protein
VPVVLADAPVLIMGMTSRPLMATAAADPTSQFFG